MLTKLTTNDISTFWPILKAGIKVTVENEGKEATEPLLNHVLTSLLSELLTCWVYLKDNKPVAEIITGVSFDVITNEKVLLILHLFSSGKMDLTMMNESLIVLTEYGKRFNCTKIVARTMSKKLARILKYINWDIKFYLSKEIN